MPELTIRARDFVSNLRGATVVTTHGAKRAVGHRLLELVCKPPGAGVRRAVLFLGC